MTASHGGQGRRQLNVRIDVETAAELETIALVEGTTQAELMRQALETLICTRKSDAAFQQKRRLALQRQVELLERLATGSGDANG